MSSYFQIIEIVADDYDALEAAHEKWLAATVGERTVVQEWVCKDRDKADTYLIIVEFPSVEAAGVNNDLPATGEIAASLNALAKEPLTFRNLDVLRHD